MTHDKEFYEENSYYDCTDEEIRDVKRKLVKTRKGHTCCICGKEIEAGVYMVCETGIDVYTGFVSCYQCTDCIDKFFNGIDNDALELEND